MEEIPPLEAFSLLDLRVGKITKVEENSKARKPAYKLWIDFGPLGMKQSSAQITQLYQPKDLIDRLVIAAVNLGTRKIAGFKSEVLVLGVPDEENRVVLLSVEREIPLGGKVY
ncbi:Methionine--tRNA ligase [Planctomycetales bacterium 10988]|nr:Methionine--tRNA ligase [Planctomycetales bacterium 10988]